jgi:hemerythrin-like domain-containing protein
MMESRGYSPVAGPTAVMRAEHVQGRALIRAMEEAIPAASRGDEAARSQWMNAARNYSYMLRQHIDKEDHCLFPMAEQALLAADQTELHRLFERVEREEIGPGVHDKYVRMADALADRYGVRKGRVPGGAKSCGCGGHS